MRVPPGVVRIVGAWLALIGVAPALASEVVAVVAWDDRLPGPSRQVIEDAEGVREALRARGDRVMDVSEMRMRLGYGEAVAAPPLDRLQRTARAAFDAGDAEGALRALSALLEALERAPGSAESFAQWKRAILQSAYVQRILMRSSGAIRAMERLAVLEPDFVVDEIQFPPSMRAAFERVRKEVAARPKFKLTLRSSGAAVSVFMNGKPMGPTPVEVALPAGRYTVRGTVGAHPLPVIELEMSDQARDVVLEAAPAAAVRFDAGPGMVLKRGEHAPALLQVGAWLGARRLVALRETVEAERAFLRGALYDIQRQELVREGQIEKARALSPKDLEMLVDFLATGRPTAGVKEVPASVLAPPLAPPQVIAPPLSTAPTIPLDRAALTVAAGGVVPVRRWTKPAAYAAGAISLGLAALAIWQGLSAHGDFDRAKGYSSSDGTVGSLTDTTAYARLQSEGQAAERRAYIAAGGAVAFAAAAIVLGSFSERHGVAEVKF